MQFLQNDLPGNGGGNPGKAGRSDILFAMKDRNFTWNEITDSGTIRQTHNPNGDSVYGVGLAVVREFQNTAVSSFLIIEAGRLTIQKNYRQLLIGARIPAYHKHQDIPVDEYIKITRGGSRRFFDPELAIYQKYKGIPIKVLQNYMYDPESLNFGVLVSFKNPFYNSLFRKIVALVLKIRPEVCW